MQPEIASICEKAARWFASVGAEVVDSCPDMHDAQHIFQVQHTCCQLQYACVVCCVGVTGTAVSFTSMQGLIQAGLIDQPHTEY